MKKIRHILLLVFLSFEIQAQHQIIDITSPDTLQSHAKLPVNVIVLKADTGAVHIKPVLPANWKVLSKSIYPVSINCERHFFLISPDKAVLAGEYLLRFQLGGNTDLNSELKHLVVAPNRKLRITSLHVPNYVKEGDTLRTTFLLENLGNTEEYVSLSSTSSSIYGYSEPIRLDPKSSVEVTTLGLVPKTELSSWTFSNNVLATDQNGVQYHAFASTQVYSNRIIKADPYLRFPLYAGAGILHYNSASGPVTSYQYVVDGNGYLDDKQEQFLYIDFRGPNQLLFPAIGSYDNYSLKYVKRGKLEVQLGDYQNYVSNLLEFSRYGRGFKAKYMTERFDYSAFFHQSRFFPGQRNSYGLQLTNKWKPGVQVNANLMGKEIKLKQSWMTATLGSLNLFMATKKTRLDAELASSFSKMGNSAGFSGRFNLMDTKWSLSSNVIITGRDFYGFYSNGKQFSNSINYNITKEISVGGSNNISRINPSYDLDDFRVSPFNTNYSLFVYYRLSSKQGFQLNYTTQETEDRREPSSFHYKEWFLNLNHNFETDRVRSQVQLRGGSAENFLASESLSNARGGYGFMLSPSVRLFDQVWLGGFLQYQHTNKFSNDNSLENLYYFGGDITGSISQKLNYSFSYRNNFAPDELFEKRSFLDANLHWEMANSRLDFRAGKSYLPGLAVANQNTLFLSLKFSRRLNIPVRKNKNIGHLQGKLKIHGGAPVSNQEIQLGQYRTVTDEQGNFYFSNLKPDTYYLSLPTESQMPGLTLWESGLKAINLVSDSISVVEIELIKTGGLEGNIVYEIGTGQPDQRKADEPLPQALIKLFNAAGSMVTMSGRDGSFSFKDIHPGSYTLSVSLVNNSGGMEVIEHTRNVEIDQDGLVKEQFVVRSFKRKIKFTDHEFRLSSNK